MSAQRRLIQGALLAALLSVSAAGNAAALIIEDSFLQKTSSWNDCSPLLYGFWGPCVNDRSGDRDWTQKTDLGPVAFQMIAESYASIDVPLFGYAVNHQDLWHRLHLSLDGENGETSTVWFHAALNGSVEAKAILAFGDAEAWGHAYMSIAQGLTNWLEYPFSFDDPSQIFTNKWSEEEWAGGFMWEEHSVSKSHNDFVKKDLAPIQMVVGDPATDLWIDIAFDSHAVANFPLGLPNISDLGVGASSDFYDMDGGLRYAFSLTQEAPFPGERSPSVPEPAALALIGIGFAGLAASRRRESN